LVLIQHDCSSLRRQGPVHFRARICLLKGCEKWFCPHHPRDRYCSDACVQAAWLWSRRQAARRYRASEGGKECRREQARRYRERVRKRREAAVSPAAECEGHPEDACEGHQNEAGSADAGKIPCSRPGCYERFAPEHRSPLKRFCCALCREALRRVRRREARWQDKGDALACEDRWERFHGPPDEG
jgi:hypothetical protein